MTRSESGRVRPDVFAPPLVVVVERTDRRGDVRERPEPSVDVGLAIADRCIGRRWGVSIRYIALTGCIRARGDFILLTSFQKTLNDTESINHAPQTTICEGRTNVQKQRYWKVGRTFQETFSKPFSTICSPN